jgi:CubicO group peptidase (beta-lactamase class C family)
VLIGLALIGAVAPALRSQGHAQAGAETFPGAQWEVATSVEGLGWSKEKLDAARAEVTAAGSAALMIVTRGQVVAAWGDVSKTYHTHSTRKSFMSALYGIYRAEGKIDTSLTLGKLGIGEKGTELTAEEKQATILDLLRSRSGVYLPAAGEVQAMRDARPVRGSHPPGTFWYYNNWDFNVLGTVFRQLTGADIFEALKTRIADPIGMEDFDLRTATYDRAPESIHPGYWFRISARDFARFGHLYLRGGRWRDRQIVPKAWVEESTRSYSVAEPSVTKSGYGLMWWIATRSERGIHVGSYTASGTGGQRLTVMPDVDTVVVNLMNTDVDGPRIGSSDWDRLLGVILQARVPTRAFHFQSPIKANAAQ